MIEGGEWMQDAICRDDPELMFPTRREQAAPAINVWRRCPVIREFAAYTERIGPSYGVWAATYIVDGPYRSEALAAVHGTGSGYRRHHQLGEIPCDRCRTAEAARKREMNAKARR